MQNSKLKIGKYFRQLKFLIVFFGLITFAVPVFGAKLYLEPNQDQYYLDDSFIVEIKIDTEGEEINTVKVSLAFPQDVLEIKDFSKGSSILTLWVEEPIFSNQNGVIDFTGGIPGGYRGKDGLLGKIILKAKSGGEANIQIKENSQVLLNDGFGTPTKLNISKGIFTVLPEKLEVPTDEWKEELKKDSIPPEPFEIKISQNSTVFEGRYFLVFSTIDKQTGIDHYEIKEGGNEYKLGESPYLLEDQNLKSQILVKAVDKTGNERMAEIIPYSPQKSFLYLIITIILILVIISWFIVKRKK